MLPVASRRLRGLLLGRRRRCGALLPCGARRASTAPLDIRNLAIIAHGDHGKTTLMDKLLLSCEESGAAHGASIDDMDGDRMVDSMDQERERGITIVSKVTSLVWKGTRLNVVDTPGHADFGGEVERVLRMVDGVVLVVDATDGPNTQTTFVTEKALAFGLRPVVVLNKIDRDTARVSEVENEVFDLLVGLGASDEQLDFQFIYASARDGWAVDDLGDRDHAEICELANGGSMAPLLDCVIDQVPAPPELDEAAANAPFALSVSMTTADSFVGKLCTGRVQAGRISTGDAIHHLPLGADGPGATLKVKEIRAARGVEWAAVESATRGDIVQIAGVSVATVGDTLGGAGLLEPLPAMAVDPPTLAMTFSPNNSPVFGKDGTKITSELIRARLNLETENNVSIVVKPGDAAESFEVCARGEMQLGVLIEALRREGFELSISPPRVLYQYEENGDKLEPVEEVTMEVDEEQCGTIIAQVTARKGVLLDMTMHPSRIPNQSTRARLQCRVSSRGMIGYQSAFQAETRGTGVLNRRMLGYEPFEKGLNQRANRNGAIVSTAGGQTTLHALDNIQTRGQLFVGSRDEVYSGQIIGEASRKDMMNVNPCKAKQLSNVRTAGKEENLFLTPPRKLSLEEAMGWMVPGELLEVTPSAFRLRAQTLELGAREREQRASKPQKAQKSKK